MTRIKRFTLTRFIGGLHTITGNRHARIKWFKIFKATYTAAVLNFITILHDNISFCCGGDKKVVGGGLVVVRRIYGKVRCGMRLYSERKYHVTVL